MVHWKMLLKKHVRRSSNAFDCTLLIPLSRFRTLWREAHGLCSCIYTNKAEEVCRIWKSASLRVGVEITGFTGFRADGSSNH